MRRRDDLKPCDSIRARVNVMKPKIKVRYLRYGVVHVAISFPFSYRVHGWGTCFSEACDAAMKWAL
jgi:hypothetical protein